MLPLHAHIEIGIAIYFCHGHLVGFIVIRGGFETWSRGNSIFGRRNGRKVATRLVFEYNN